MYLPCHLYGELSKSDEGITVIRNENIVPNLVEHLESCIKSPLLFDNTRRQLDQDNEEEELSLLPLKSTLWALVRNYLKYSGPKQSTVEFR